MRSSKVLAAVMSLTIVAGAAMPFGSYAPAASLTAFAAEESTVSTDELTFTVYADHAEVSGVNNETLGSIIDAGADIVVSGSCFFNGSLKWS